MCKTDLDGENHRFLSFVVFFCFLFLNKKINIKTKEEEKTVWREPKLAMIRLKEICRIPRRPLQQLEKEIEPPASTLLLFSYYYYYFFLAVCLFVCFLFCFSHLSGSLSNSRRRSGFCEHEKGGFIISIYFCHFFLSYFIVFYLFFA